MAGIISMITVWFDAITDPIIGGLSDEAKIEGRRGPFLIYVRDSGIHHTLDVHGHANRPVLHSSLYGI